MQEKLFKSLRNAQELDASRMFNAVLSDNGFQQWILNLNKSQLFNGENSIGVSLDKIGGGYSLTTEVLNEGEYFDFQGEARQKVAGQAPFLLDSGEYYNSYTLKLGNGLFVIDSNPIKGNDNLEAKYGNQLEGLNDENLQKLIDVIREKFIQETKIKLAA